MAFADWYKSVQHLLMCLVSGVDEDDNAIPGPPVANLAKIAGVVPQMDDTDKIAVSVYGMDAAAGDTALPVNAQGLKVAVNSAAPALIDGYVNNPAIPQTAAGDAPVILPTYLYLFNGSTWDRMRNNVYGTAIAEGTYNSTQSSPNIETYNARGVLVLFRVTSVPGTDTVVCNIQGVDPSSGIPYDLCKTSPLDATGNYLLLAYPGVSTSPTHIDVAESIHIGARIKIKVAHSGSGDFVYGVYYHLLV